MWGIREVAINKFAHLQKVVCHEFISNELPYAVDNEDNRTHNGGEFFKVHKSNAKGTRREVISTLGGIL